MVDLIIRLHTNCIVKIRAGDSDVTVESTVGVKQGDSLAPVLFSLYFQACMEVLADQWVFEKPLFAYKLDNVLTGRKYNVKPDAYFEFYRSLYADDGAFLLTSRKEVEQAVPLLFSVLKAFGLSMHVGRNGNKAKTEAVFYPSAARIKNPDPIDTQDIEVDGGIVSFTKQFKYLGSLIADKLTDDAECDARISAASKAFGALKTQLFGVRHICTRAKTHAYEALVLSLLFYGSECWILSAAMRDKILKFHRRCIRFMCGVTLDSMRSKNIHHTDLEKRLRISDVLSILESRRLQWLGHVYRMPADRLPRRLLSSWVTNPRPKGRPHLTYGHGLVNDLKTHGLGDTWSALALDRVSWRAKVKAVRKCKPLRGRAATAA